MTQPYEICAPILRAPSTSKKVQHRASITEPKAVGALLRAIDDVDGQPMTKAGAAVICYDISVRPGELRYAEWKEFDISGAVWNISANKMKSDRPHKVPSSR